MSARPSPLRKETPLSMTVHSAPALQTLEASTTQRAVTGRWYVWLILLVCVAPVIASYFIYYAVRPEGRRNFGELIEPQRPMPALVGRDLEDKPVPLQALKDQWLLISVAGGACNDACQNNLYFQRQLLTSLGKERMRANWVWLIDDQENVPAQLHPALKEATVLRVDKQALAQWLQASQHHVLEDHLYVVDPMGNWMLRFPAHMDLHAAAKAKKDLGNLLRVAAAWEKPVELSTKSNKVMRP